jgi:hypothetical protein
MIECSRVNGEKIRCMGRGCLSGPMEESTKVATSMTRSMEKGSSNGKFHFLKRFSYCLRPDGREYIGDWVNGF